LVNSWTPQPIVRLFISLIYIEIYIIRAVCRHLGRGAQKELNPWKPFSNVNIYTHQLRRETFWTINRETHWLMTEAIRGKFSAVQGPAYLMLLSI